MSKKQPKDLLILITLALCTACGSESPTDSTGKGCERLWGMIADAGYIETSKPGTSFRTYESHAPIRIEHVHATADNPYVVEGYEIHSDTSNCIEVKYSENIIIRNNYLHDCMCSGDPKDDLRPDQGFALLVGASEHIEIASNILEHNRMGVAVYDSRKIELLHNTIRTTVVASSVRLERVEEAEIAGNYLLDNGVPEWFWAPGNRIIGIHVVRSDGIDVHDNTVLRSSSDGIAVGGQIDGGGLTTPESDWTGTASRIRIHNNLILDNMEIGVWLVRARHLEIFNNTIRSSCFGPSGRIVLDFDVEDSEVYRNKLVNCRGGSFIGIAMSHNNYIHDNIHYTEEGKAYPVLMGDDPINDQIKADWAGIPYSPSFGNVFENNLELKVGGALRDAMMEKLELAEREGTAEPKGWFSCEIREGVFDEACVEAEKVKGDQGVPRAYLIYTPLMADPDEFIVEEGCEDVYD